MKQLPSLKSLLPSLQKISKEALKELLTIAEVELEQRLKEDARKKQKSHELKVKQKENKLIDSFGRENFNEFKSLIRKYGDLGWKEKPKIPINIEMNLEIEYSFIIDFNGNISCESYFDDEEDKIYEKTHKEISKYKSKKLDNIEKEVNYLLNKYKKICSDKNIDIKKVRSIIESIIHEEDNMIKDIIE